MGIKEAITGDWVYTMQQIIKITGTVIARKDEYRATCGVKFSVRPLRVLLKYRHIKKFMRPSSAILKV